MIAYLRSRGIPLSKILRAEEYARELTNSPEPFVTEPMWTVASDIFTSFQNKLMDITMLGQYAFAFMARYLDPVQHGLSFNEDGLAQTWSPTEHILINPRKAFGASCVAGTRIHTEVLWCLHKIGQSHEELAETYRLKSEEVRAAIAWEERLALAA